jgi:hypothetical protein
VIHKEVERELFGTDWRTRQRPAKVARRSVSLSGKQIAVALLMMMILGSWFMDSMHMEFVPREMHDTVADWVDTQLSRLPSSRVTPTVDTIVAHNPLDDSPITFGSVVLLGVVCVTGLVGMYITSSQPKPA